ncbi:MinD/ParA family protein [Kitasatospora sp. NPDC059648]|uniref:MinD/ParA family ATP-binding protein n=1 Tax=Kitasatospora sp. NPDC059648 TaxID=3346894 RepID=UPI00368F8CB1
MEPEPLVELPPRRGLGFLRRRRPVQLAEAPVRPTLPTVGDRVRDGVLRRRLTVDLPQQHVRIAVVSLKGGSGRTSTALGLGDVLAGYRREPVAALDAVPLRGSLAPLSGGRSAASVMDLLAAHETYAAYNSPAPPSYRRPSGLAVIASEHRPDARYVLGADGYRWLSDQLLPRHYGIVVTDTPAGLSDSLMSAVLSTADLVVLTTTTGAESASLAHDALVWMHRQGYGRIARRALVVLNAVRTGDPGVPAETLSKFFAAKAGAAVTIPWDRHLAAGQPIDAAALEPATRTAYLTLGAAAVAALARQK